NCFIVVVARRNNPRASITVECQPPPNGNAEARRECLETCQQSSPKRFFQRFFFVPHCLIRIQNGGEVFQPWHDEDVEDQPGRQILQDYLFAIRKLKYIPLWAL